MTKTLVKESTKPKAAGHGEKVQALKSARRGKPKPERSVKSESPILDSGWD